MDDLVTWLLAQIAEDERVARKAGREINAWGGSWISWVDSIEHRSIIESEHMSDLMESYGPARVLAECKAKRRLISFANDAAADADRSIRSEWCADPALQETLLALLALPYAGRPGYREEWRS